MGLVLTEAVASSESLLLFEECWEPGKTQAFLFSISAVGMYNVFRDGELSLEMGWGKRVSMSPCRLKRRQMVNGCVLLQGDPPKMVPFKPRKGALKKPHPNQQLFRKGVALGGPEPVEDCPVLWASAPDLPPAPPVGGPGRHRQLCSRRVSWQAPWPGASCACAPARRVCAGAGGQVCVPVSLCARVRGVVRAA